MTKLLLESETFGPKTVLLDNDDLSVISGRQWSLTVNGRYAAASEKNNKVVLMHRLIMGASPTDLVDHINRNTLDNRRINLRLVNKSGNELNKPKRKGAHTSKYKGVVFCNENHRKSKWAVRITVNSRTYHVGHFPIEAIAAWAYNEAARRVGGGLVLLNEIPSIELKGLDLEPYRKKASTVSTVLVKRGKK